MSFFKGLMRAFTPPKSGAQKAAMTQAAAQNQAAIDRQAQAERENAGLRRAASRGGSSLLGFFNDLLPGKAKLG